jgi:hypothetical protein
MYYFIRVIFVLKFFHHNTMLIMLPCTAVLNPYLSVCKKEMVVPLLCIEILAHVMSELWRGSGSHARPPSFRWNRYLRTTSVVKVPGVPSKLDRGRNANPTVTLHSSVLNVRDILRPPKTDVKPPLAVRSKSESRSRHFGVRHLDRIEFPATHWPWPSRASN